MILSIREMKITDTSQVADISMRAWQSAYKGIMPDSILDNIDVKKREENWANGFTSLPDLIRTVAVDDTDTVLGYTTGSSCRDIKGPGNGELWAIYVDPKFVGKGIGKILLNDFKERMKKAGFLKMYVWVLKDNYHARNFYKSQDAKLITNTKTFKIDETSLEEVAYEFIL
jgi:ribosomal protein S18 acetylase RimI-like enzyme